MFCGDACEFNMIPCCACMCTCVLTECESVANLTFVSQMFTLELAENALTLQSVLSVFTRKFERNAVFTKCHEPIRFGSRPTFSERNR